MTKGYVIYVLAWMLTVTDPRLILSKRGITTQKTTPSIHMPTVDRLQECFSYLPLILSSILLIRNLSIVVVSVIYSTAAGFFISVIML